MIPPEMGMFRRFESLEKQPRIVRLRSPIRVRTLSPLRSSDESRGLRRAGASACDGRCDQGSRRKRSSRCSVCSKAACCGRSCLARSLVLSFQRLPRD